MNVQPQSGDSEPPPNEQMKLAAIVGGGMMVAGSFMDWATATTAFGELGFKGTSGDGKITLGLGIITALAFLESRRRSATIGVTLAIIGLLMAAYEISNVSHLANSVDSDYIHASVGVGLWVLGAGALVATVAGINYRRSLPIVL